MYDLLHNMAIITEENPADNLSGMWATVITGLVVVFIILALLIGFLYLMSMATKGMDKLSDSRRQKKAEYTAKPAPVPAAPVVLDTVDEEENDEEIIAVIAAAIAAYSAADGKQYVVKKIKRSDKKTRSDWGNVGVRENTRPF
ncbi:MAG: OadG family protein [Eubacterium sp.]|nr:OadG family protein [Eubacterium sp.]